MDHTSHRCLASVVDISHGACDGASGRDTAKERRHDIGHTLSDELGIGVVAIANHTIGNGSRKKRLDRTEDGNGECDRHEAAYHIVGDGRNNHLRELSLDLEAVADGVNTLNAKEMLHSENDQCAEDDGIERTRYLVQSRYALESLWREDDDEHTRNGNHKVP